VFRASAPVRLDFAGGWTDVAPFATEEGGVVVNAAIELRAHAELELGGKRHLLRSLDLGQTAELQGGAWTGAQAGELDLQQAALRRADVGPCVLSTRSEVPPGSGLGGSGALGVALVAALDAARGMPRSLTGLAEEAFQLEAFEAALPGGKQDQYAAALGGFHRLEFAGNAVTVKALSLDPEFLTLLEQRILICYTGTSRVSSSMISRVMRGYSAGQPEVVNGLRAMADVAERLGMALSAADLAATGRLLAANWRFQQQLDPGMRTPDMARLEAAMTAAGALGGKAAGAGAGGSMFFLVGGDVQDAARAAEDAGARVLPFRWASEGVRVEAAP
jgi:D-glycero-alpha-D-manno-heptose-7-phosphate kinase